MKKHPYNIGFYKEKVALIDEEIRQLSFLIERKKEYRKFLMKEHYSRAKFWKRKLEKTKNII